MQKRYSDAEVGGLQSVEAFKPCCILKFRQIDCSSGETGRCDESSIRVRLRAVMKLGGGPKAVFNGRLPETV